MLYCVKSTNSLRVNSCVLIGGGSGLIGTRLTELLKQKGCQVRHLGRKAKDGAVKTFAWDIENGSIDERAFEGVDVVINLAGANVSDKRWSAAYKKTILNSRTVSTKLIVDFLNSKPHQVKHFVSGSAIGWYGLQDNGKWFHENDPAGTDFMSQVVKAWEHEATLTKDPKVKLAIVRTGIVVSEKGGAVEEMSKPIKMYVGSPLGTGKQIVGWIHLEDECAIFLHIIENSLTGVFNAVAPNPVTNEEMTKAIAKKLKKPLLLPNVPGFALKLVIGEMADAVLGGTKVSADKIQSTGFKFKFETLESALNIEP